VVAKHEIRALARRIAAGFRPERIILFGSYARGDQTADSDVDLLVIVPHTGKGWRMAAQIRGAVRADFPVDLLVRAPQEVRARLQAGDPFLREVTEHGEVLYESQHP
jgi:uncharacterized protein